MTTCECGCGNPPKAGNRFIHGHNNSVPKVPFDELYVIEERGYKTPCWICKVASNDWYVRISVNGRTHFAHRVSYELHVGPIPVGLVLDHLCRVPACVNPAHLEPVTQAENLRRGAGTRLTIEDVREIRGAVGVTQADLADRFGVSETTIYGVLKGRTWKDVAAA